MSLSETSSAELYNSASAESTCHLTETAEEIVLHILEFLSRNDLLAVSSTCHHLRPLAFDASLSTWQRSLHLDVLAQPSKALNFLLHHPAAPISKCRMLRFSRVSSIAAYLAICAAQGGKLDHVETVCIGDSRHFVSFFDAKKMGTILRSFPNLRRLHFDSRLSSHLAHLSTALSKCSKLELISFQEEGKVSTSAWVQWLYSRNWNGAKLFDSVKTLKRVDERSLAVTEASPPVDQLLAPIDVYCAICQEKLFSNVQKYWIAPPSQHHISFELLTFDAPVVGSTTDELWGDSNRFNCNSRCHKKQWLVDCGSEYVDRHGFNFAIACGPELAKAVFAGTQEWICLALKTPQQQQQLQAQVQLQPNIPPIEVVLNNPFANIEPV
eukprot:TRINITY_DN11661_c0_g1_i1.p1 TRINITY_DN11661_c0_g1~~TRINITY_DN11661_c0_g1_i1.p1  ORF type:complete len:382 (+),score=48.59 TRINITY_DN11661_c0_g1_i1:41-1186(+)